MNNINDSDIVYTNSINVIKCKLDGIITIKQTRLTAVIMIPKKITRDDKNNGGVVKMIAIMIDIKKSKSNIITIKIEMTIVYENQNRVVKLKYSRNNSNKLQ